MGKGRSNPASTEAKWQTLLFGKRIEAFAFRPESLKRRAESAGDDLLFAAVPMLENSRMSWLFPELKAEYYSETLLAGGGSFLSGGQYRTPVSGLSP